MHTVHLEWVRQSGDVLYDVIAGSLSDLRFDSGIDAADCVASGLTEGSWDNALGQPEPDQGQYFLVRATDDCGPGSLGFGSTAERLFEPCGLR